MESVTVFEVSRLKDVDINNAMGTTVYVKALVSKVELKETKTKSHYLNINIGDGDVKINCKMWNASDATQAEFVPGHIYELTLSVESYAGKPSCVIKGFKRLDEKVIDYVERVEDVDYYIGVVKNAIELINHESIYYSIVVTIVNAEVIDKMSVHPAARSWHHNLLGGLIMHIGTMLRAGYSMAQIYNLDVNLVLAGIILHDIGKLKELLCSIETGEITYTPIGSLYGHIQIGCQEIDKAAALLEVEDTEEVMLLKHCVLSHHGKLEFGSPVEPAIPEAVLISALDGFDAEVYKYNHTIEHMVPGTSIFEAGKVYYRHEEKMSVPDMSDDAEDSEE